MDRFLLRSGDQYYGVISLAGERTVTSTKIQQEATITTRKEMEESLLFLAKSGVSIIELIKVERHTTYLKGIYSLKP